MADLIIVGLVIVAMMLSIHKMIRDKRNGIGSCGHRCSECPSHGSCSSSTDPVVSENFKKFVRQRSKINSINN
ncbi:MAG: FeoB-associated Cys-rich membrane protein [Lachnospiraceae bacterium]|nr:FeoB-associated Cys-rich membrane protein [Lachnospiraceae bacterium]